MPSFSDMQVISSQMVPAGSGDYPEVPWHPVPDDPTGLGQTNLSDADYYRMRRGLPPAPGGGAAAPGPAGQGAEAVLQRLRQENQPPPPIFGTGLLRDLSRAGPATGAPMLADNQAAVPLSPGLAAKEALVNQPAEQLGAEAPARAAGPGQVAGKIANIGAGINEATTGLLGLPVDLATAGINLGARTIGLPQITNPVGGSHFLNQLLGLAGANPENVVPETETQDLLRAAARGAAGVALPSAAAGRLIATAAPSVARGVAAQLADTGGAGGLATGVAGGVTGEVARQIAPPSIAPYADIVGNLVGGAATALPVAAARAGTSAVRGAISDALNPGARVNEIVGQSILHDTGGTSSFAPAPLERVPLTTAEATPGGSPVLAQAIDTLSTGDNAYRQAFESRQNAAMLQGLGQGEPPRPPDTVRFYSATPPGRAGTLFPDRASAEALTGGEPANFVDLPATHPAVKAAEIVDPETGEKSYSAIAPAPATTSGLRPLPHLGLSSDQIREAGQVAARGSTRAARAIRGAAEIIGKEERRLWNTPELSRPNISTSSVRDSVRNELAKIETATPGLYGALDESSAIRRALHDLDAFGDKAPANELNAVSSRLRRVQRDPSAEADVRLIAGRLAQAVQDGIWNAPEVAGTPDRVIIPQEAEWDDLLGGSIPAGPGAPRIERGIKPNPALVRDLKAARAFTRREAEVLGHASFENVLARNSSGNLRAAPGSELDRFFGLASGTDKPGSIRDLGAFVRDVASEWRRIGVLKAGGEYDPIQVAQVAEGLAKGTKDFLLARFYKAITTNAQDMDQNWALNYNRVSGFWRADRDLFQRSGAFTPDEMGLMDQFADTAQMIKNGRDRGLTRGSPTTSRAAQLTNPKYLIDAFLSPLARRAVPLAAAGLGAALTHMFGEGIIGGMIAAEMTGVGAVGAHFGANALLQRLYRVPHEQLMVALREAYFNPEIAKDLAARVGGGARPPKASQATIAWMRTLLATAVPAERILAP